MFTRNARLFLGLLLVLALPLNSGGFVVYAQGEDPTLQVEINHDWVQGRHWPSGHLIRLMVNGVEEDAQVVYDVPWGTEVGFSEWDTGFEYDLQPGDVVTLEDTVTGVIKTHTALDIAITDVDLGANTVTGMAAPGSDLIVEAHDPCAERISVTADGGGSWTAGFGCALVDVEHIHAEQHDPGDTTYTSFFWSPPPPPPEPSLQVELNHDWVVGYEWPSGHLITLIINDTEIDTQEVVEFPWGTEVNFNEWDTGFEYDIQPGDVVTLEDKATGETKTHTAFDISITEVDITANIVEGYADPGGELSVWAHWPCDEGVWVRTDAVDGSWTANFSCDLSTVEHIHVEQYEIDGENWTTFFWSAPPPPPEPSLQVEINHDWVQGWDWPLGHLIRLLVNGVEMDVQVVYDVPWGTEVGFSEWDTGFEYDLQPGDVVTLEDTVTGVTKTHTALDILITNVDVMANIVTGEALPGSDLIIEAHDPCEERVSVTTDGGGYWAASFGCALSDVEHIHAEQYDPEDTTYTSFFWDWPNLQVEINQDWVNGWNWPVGDSILLTINGEEMGEQVVTESPWGGTEVNFNSWDTGFEYNIQPGDVVTLEDLNTGMTQTHIALDIAITNVDIYTNTVEGYAETGSELFVGACDEGIWVTSSEVDGSWVAVFSCDLSSAEYIHAEQYDLAGRNYTGFLWSAPTTWEIGFGWDTIIVFSHDEIVLRSGWGACTPGLVQAFQQAAHIDITINGEPLYPEGEEALYWSEIESMELDGCKAAPEGDQASVSRWRYTLSPLEPGIYEVYVHYWLDHPIIDGGDWDGDGKMDKFEGTLIENTITIIVK